MHIFDYMLELIIPYWLSIIICDINYTSSTIFLILGQLNGILTHSGYNFPFCPNPKDHLKHHLYSNINFGVGGPWDYLLNTL